MELKKLIGMGVLLFLLFLPMGKLFVDSPQGEQLYLDYDEEYFSQNPVVDNFNATNSYMSRKNTYLQISENNDAYYDQITHVYQGTPVNETLILRDIELVDSYQDTSDFDMNFYLRMLYFNQNSSVFSTSLLDRLEYTVLHFKYWLDEPVLNESAPSSYDMYYWTENHMILMHAAELLAGQLYKAEIFPYSGMTGQDHIDHALPYIDRWLDWRADFGFSEWYSNIYYTLDIVALLNIIEFSENALIATKASMVMDQMNLEFINFFFDSRFGTAHGRTGDKNQMGTSLQDPAGRESPSVSAWLMLGLGEIPTSGDNRGAISIATSDKFVVPPILESIANASRLQYEGFTRTGMNIADGPSYGIPYDEENLMYWWGMSAPASPEILDLTLAYMEKYDLSPKLIFNDPLFLDVLNIGGALIGGDASDYSEKISDITRGVAMESLSTYTYRTPHYQLSGAQDYHKGRAGIQEHIWQATLSDQAMIYTNSPGGVSPQMFTGGWKPRGTMYQNVGVFQYDRVAQDFLGEIVLAYLSNTDYTHAYFPQWAFDEFTEKDGWLFGREGDGYVALYSYVPGEWIESYEYRSEGKKNVYITELGSADEYIDFDDFVAQVSAAEITIKELEVGFSLEYLSPSQGLVTVSWDGDFVVDGNTTDLGPYPRFENPFVNQVFASRITTISYGGYTLELDFDAVSRTVTEDT
ncbi:MAG: hypothetical protein INQ03_22465 [Candidatus Heimdallarchaeota archaeon]|nr:hypothetical protein [Candidatus Heimdallarchaeota archaeon]